MADRGAILHRIVVWNLTMAILLSLVAASVSALDTNALDANFNTSNYAGRGLDVEYQGTGLPQEATLDGKVTKLDDLSHLIVTNRTRATLSCASRAMEVDLEFTEPFFGIVYADFNRQSPCSFVGKGQTKYHYELPLSGCGTLQDPLRVFTNNIIVRFHPWLEMDGDEVKTIVCRYPPPVVPPPANPAILPILANEIPPLENKPEALGELQILLIICALLFLALMLFGVACSYFCLKKRNIKLIRRRRALSSGPGSIITKVSGSTLGNMSMFDGLKIPRAHPISSSGSETQLVIAEPHIEQHSDTLPSDYPSESRSSPEMEEGDFRIRRPSPASSEVRETPAHFENQAFVHAEDDRLSSVYSDAHAQIDVDTFGAAMIPRVDPSFDVNIRVKEKRRSPPPSPTPSSISDAETRVSVMKAQERKLTTILEKEEWRNTESMAAKQAGVGKTPPLEGPPSKRPGPPPAYAEVKRRPVSQRDRSDASMYAMSQRSIPENDTWSVTEHIDIPDGRAPRPVSPTRSLTSLNTEMTDPHSIGEIVMKTSRPYKAPAPKPPSVLSSDYESQGRAMSEYQEKNKILLVSDDIQVHTSTTRRVEEDEEAETLIVPTPERRIPPPKTPSMISEYASEDRAVSDVYSPPGQVVPRKPKLTSHEVDDVFLSTITETRTREDEERIRREITEYHTRPRQPALPPKWDVTIRKIPAPVEERPPSETTDWDEMSQSEFGSERPRSFVELDRFSEAHVNQGPPINWDVLIRVLEPPVEDDTESILTIEDREKWQQIITTESTLRSLLTEATVREDFERIRSDQRYERLFEPTKWDVIIRVLSEPVQDDPNDDTRSETTVNSEPPMRRYRKRSDIDPRSRKSSLAPVHELDPAYRPHGPGSTRSGRSTVRSDMDVRSLAETTVNFNRYEPDAWSESSGHTFRSSMYPRSTADRSHSEIMERQAYPEDWDNSDAESGRMSRPSLARSTSEFTEHWTTTRVPFDRMSSVSGYSYASSTHRRPMLERSSTEVLEEVPHMMSGYPESETNSTASSPPGQRRRLPYERVLSIEDIAEVSETNLSLHK